MKTAVLPIALMIAATGCGPVEPLPGPPPGPARCDASAAQRLVGQRFQPHMRERLRRMTRSRVVRVVRPGEAVTMDFRGDRVTVSLDDRGRIESVRCG